MGYFADHSRRSNRQKYDSTRYLSSKAKVVQFYHRVLARVLQATAVVSSTIYIYTAVYSCTCEYSYVTTLGSRKESIIGNFCNF